MWSKKLVCSICGRAKGRLAEIFIPWFRCDKCGVVCNQCDARGGFLNLGKVSALSAAEKLLLLSDDQSCLDCANPVVNQVKLWTILTPRKLEYPH
jgi:hypothetical protein